MIHGQKRLQLSRTEQAIPHILLDRQQGISWQMIQKVISQLQQPIDALQLCQALQMYQEKRFLPKNCRLYYDFVAKSCFYLIDFQH